MPSFKKALDSLLNNSLGSLYVTLQVTPRYPQVFFNLGSS
jgi:hypothetical protein